MELALTLERVVKLVEEDEEKIFEMLKKAEFVAMERRNTLPTLTQVLYHQTEDEMLDIGDLTGYAFNQ
jgi:hypothetical protein